MMKAQDRVKCLVLGKAYAQQWNSAGWADDVDSENDLVTLVNENLNNDCIEFFFHAY